MRRIARTLALAVGAAAVLVPAQPALADGTLNVEHFVAGAVATAPEEVNRATETIHILKATLTQSGSPAAPASVNNQTIAFEIEGGPQDPDMGLPTAPLNPADLQCTTDAGGVCYVTHRATSEAAAPQPFRAWHEETPVGSNSFPDDADTTETATGDDADDTDVVSVLWRHAVLNIGDATGQEEVAATPTATATITATVTEKTPPAGTSARPLLANVDAEIIGTGPNRNQNTTSVDMECTTDPTTGRCSLVYTPGPTTGVDIVQAWVDENDNPQAGTPPGSAPTGDETQGNNFEGDASETTPGAAGDVAEPDTTDLARVNISVAQVLDVSPEGLGSPPKPLGTQSQLTARVTQGTTPQSGVTIAASVLTGGPNAGKTATCTTGASGECTLNYVGTAAGTDRVRAVIDADNNGQPNEADSTEEVSTAGGTPEPDTTDTVQVEWASVTDPDDDDDDTANSCDRTRSGAGDDELIIGTKKKDNLCGFGGSDTLRGKGGNDNLKGGGGGDTLAGGKGDDRLRGQGGKDNLKGGSGDDRCSGERERAC